MSLYIVNTDNGQDVEHVQQYVCLGHFGSFRSFLAAVLICTLRRDSRGMQFIGSNRWVATFLVHRRVVQRIPNLITKSVLWTGGLAFAPRNQELRCSVLKEGLTQLEPDEYNGTLNEDFALCPADAVS